MAKKINRIFFLFLTTAIITSCSSKGNKLQDITNIDIEQCKQNDLTNVGFKIKSTDFIPLETSNECLVGQVSQIAQENGNWFLNSGQKTLYKFDRNGKFLCGIGTQGNGPGEYLAINTFGITDGKVYIVSSNQNKICVYTTDGKWVNDITDVDCLKFATSMTPVADGCFLVANSISFNKDMPLYGLWNPADPKVLMPIMTTDYSSTGSYQWAIKPLSPNEDGVYALIPLSGDINYYDSKTKEMSTAFSVQGIFPNKIPAEGDYSKIQPEALKAKSNIIMTLCKTDSYLILGMTHGSLIWNIKEQRGAVVKNQLKNERSENYPLFPLMLKYNDAKSAAALIPAENIIEYYESNDIPLPINGLNEESNPIIVNYSFSE